MNTQEQTLPSPVSVPAIPAARGRTDIPWAVAAFLATAARLMLWRERARQRLCLARLDARLLDDIGVTREEALREARKWFWQE